MAARTFTSGHRWSCLASIGARSAIQPIKRGRHYGEGGKARLSIGRRQYTKDDFVVAYRLASSFTRRGWLFLILSILLICIAAFFFFRYDGAPLRLQLLVPVYIALGYALYGLAARGLAVPWLGRRAYTGQPLAQLTRRIELRPEGLRFQSPRGETTILWRDLIKWRAIPKTTLLYASPSLFLLIPARLAALGFPMDDLKATLARELGPPVR